MAIWSGLHVSTQCRGDTVESASAIRFVSSRPIDTSRSASGRATPASAPPMAFRLANIKPFIHQAHYPICVPLSDQIASVVLPADLIATSEENSGAISLRLCPLAACRPLASPAVLQLLLTVP